MGDDRSDPPVMLAAIAGAHGVGGEVRLKLFAEGVESLRRHQRFDAAGRTLVLKGLKQAGKSLVARFEGIADRDAAEALRGTQLTVPRSALPSPGPDEIYIADLVGRAVLDLGGAPLGRVVGVENYGATDLLEIEAADGRRSLVPFTKEAVPETSPDLRVNPDFLA